MTPSSARFAVFVAIGIVSPGHVGAAERHLTGIVRETATGLSVGETPLRAVGPAQRDALAACFGANLCEVRVEPSANGSGARFVSVGKPERLASPRDVLDLIYRRVALWSTDEFHVADGDARALYTVELADLVARSARKARLAQEEDPAHAPWVTAQEWDVRAVAIQVDELGGGAALGIARYRNFAEEDPKIATVTYDLRETPEGWRIADIVFPDPMPADRRRLSDRLRAYVNAAAGTTPAETKVRSDPPKDAPPSEPGEKLYGQIFGPKSDSQSAVSLFDQPIAPPSGASGARPDATGRRSPSVSPRPGFRPLVLEGPIVTLGRCHMDECSWAKWLQVAVRPAANEITMQIRLLGGTSPAGRAKRTGTRWNRQPHTVTVLCSHARPTVTFDGESTVLPLRPNDPVAGAQMSSENLYYTACHSDMDASADRAGKYGYDVQVDE